MLHFQAIPPCSPQWLRALSTLQVDSPRTLRTGTLLCLMCLIGLSMALPTLAEHRDQKQGCQLQERTQPGLPQPLPALAWSQGFPTLLGEQHKHSTDFPECHGGLLCCVAVDSVERQSSFRPVAKQVSSKQPQSMLGSQT